MYAEFFDGQAATLLGVAGFVNRAPGVRDSERFDLEAVLIGGHTNAASYSAVHVRFDVLNGWANPEPLTRELEDGRTVLTVDPRRSPKRVGATGSSDFARTQRPVGP